MMSQTIKPKFAAIPDYKSAGNEVNCNAMRTDYDPRACVAHPVHVYGVPYNSFYGGCNSMGYPEPDRIPGGCQTNVPTITLTSHRIQFGCQQNQVPPQYRGQRFEEPGYRPHYHVMRHGKHWPDPSMDHSTSSSKPSNRGRTTYTDEQIAELESVFNSNPYPTSQTRQQLAYKIDVPEGKVKIWFQNRRARAKKFKLTYGGGGGGSWRMHQNESRNAEDHNNQNNNNMNSGCSKSTLSSSDSSFSINTLLPLPTKPTINSSLNSSWSCGPVLYPKSTSASHVNHPCASQSVSSSSNYALAKYASDPFSSECKSWNVVSQASMPQHFPTVYRPDLSREDSRNASQLQQCARTTTCEQAQDGTQQDPPGSHGNVPDLITQTSRVGIREGNSAMADVVKPSSPTADGMALHNGEQEADSSLDNSSSSLGHPAMINDGASSSTAVVAANSSYVDQHYHDDMRPQKSADLLSPPPIRRLVFPFHTLSDSRSGRTDFGMQGFLSYPPPPQKFSTLDTYQRPYCSGGVQAQGSIQHAAEYSATIAGLVPNTSGGLPEISEGRGMYVDPKCGMYGGGWEPDVIAYKPCQVSAVYQGNGSYSNIIRGRLNSSSQSDQIQDDEEVDDGEATDDATDDVGGMEGVKPEEERPYASTFEYPVSEQKLTTSCWNTRSGNILIKTANFETEQSAQNKSSDGHADDKLPNNGIIASAEGSGWSSQLMTAMYPPVSTQLVG